MSADVTTLGLRAQARSSHHRSRGVIASLALVGLAAASAMAHQALAAAPTVYYQSVCADPQVVKASQTQDITRLQGLAMPSSSWTGFARETHGATDAASRTSCPAEHYYTFANDGGAQFGWAVQVPTAVKSDLAHYRLGITVWVADTYANEPNATYTVQDYSQQLSGIGKSQGFTIDQADTQGWQGAHLTNSVLTTGTAWVLLSVSDHGEQGKGGCPAYPRSHNPGAKPVPMINCYVSADAVIFTFTHT